LNEKNKIYLTDFFKELSEINNYCEKKISEISEKILKKNNIKFKDLGEPLRMILTGSTKAPSIKDIIKILGINETINRLKRFI
jgi:glutamyl-tRNA synthetase